MNYTRAEITAIRNREGISCRGCHCLGLAAQLLTAMDTINANEALIELMGLTEQSYADEAEKLKAKIAELESALRD